MAWKCIVPGKEIEDEKSDKRSAKGIEKYMISSKAIYFEGKYLPISLITGVSIHDSVYNPNCCCGRGIPVKKIKIEYTGGEPLILMLEKGKNAEEMAGLINGYKQ